MMWYKIQNEFGLGSDMTTQKFEFYLAKKHMRRGPHDLFCRSSVKYPFGGDFIARIFGYIFCPLENSEIEFAKII